MSVGVLFDYFRAPDASTAAAVLGRVGGPTSPDLDAPVLDAVAGKGFEPEVMMVTLQSLLTGVPYEELPNGELLAMEGEDGPCEVLPFLDEVTTWPAVPGRPMSACIAGCACSGEPHHGSRLTLGLGGGAALGPALSDVGAAAGGGGALQESVELLEVAVRSRSR